MRACFLVFVDFLGNYLLVLFERQRKGARVGGGGGEIGFLVYLFCSLLNS